ncbi:MAG: 30S ribosomal protein S21 [Candidatus Magasanikbacteria bacterium]|nr:30S ribosomal protein S21 [Candidatus Magasanikbacteria bacterium]
MAIVKRRKGESFDGFMRRFRKRIQESGKVLQAKKVQFRRPEKSKNLLRQSALVRLAKREQRAYLMKVGKFREDEEEPRRKF